MNLCTPNWPNSHTFGLLLISLCTHSEDAECTGMATITKLASGNWRGQVRRKGCYAADTFRRRRDAEEWALNTERCINQGISPKWRPKGPAKTFGNLVDLHVHDLHEGGKPTRHSKAAVMKALKRSIGSTKIAKLNRARLIEYGKRQTKQGAGPATLAIDFSFVRMLLSHACPLTRRPLPGFARKNVSGRRH